MERETVSRIWVAIAAALCGAFGAYISFFMTFSRMDCSNNIFEAPISTQPTRTNSKSTQLPMPTFKGWPAPNPPIATKESNNDESSTPTYVVGVKSSIETAEARMPNLLFTFLPHIKNVYLFSDFDIKVGNYILNGVIKNADGDDRDFTDPIEAQFQENIDTTSNITKSGWRRDQLKFVPALAEMYRLYPTVDWYIMIDDDTYLFKHKLESILRNSDPTVPIYAGKAAGGGCWKRNRTEKFKNIFAHGGSGVILSRVAVEKLLTIKDRCQSVMQHKDTIYDCYVGDGLLALCLQWVDIQLNNFISYEHFNPDSNFEKNQYTWKSAATELLSSHKVRTMANALELYAIDPVNPLSPYKGRWVDLFNYAIAKGKLVLDESIHMNYRLRAWSSVFRNIDNRIYDAPQCQQACREEPKCVAWQYNYNATSSVQKRCSLFKDIIITDYSAGYASGHIYSNYAQE